MSKRAPHATDTSIDAYLRVLDRGDDVTDQRRVAALIGQADDGMTIEEIGERAEELPSNTIQPRVNELLRKGVVYRDGTRNTSNDRPAKVHYLTDTGERFVRGEVDPEEVEPISKQRRKVLDIARKYVNGEVDEDILQIAIERHDDLKRRQNPDWEPE